MSGPRDGYTPAQRAVAQKIANTNADTLRLAFHLQRLTAEHAGTSMAAEWTRLGLAVVDVRRAAWCALLRALTRGRPT